MLSLSDTVNRFLVVCEDMCDKRVTDSGCCHNTALEWALSLYLQRLQLLVRAGKLTREKYEALVKIYEKDNIALRTHHVERWNKFLDSLDAAPDFPMTLRGDDVKYHEMEAVSLCDILYIDIIIKVLRKNISNLG
jgi:hypothetical protein